MGKDAVPPGGDETARAAGPPEGDGDSCKGSGSGSSDDDEPCKLEGVDPSGGDGGEECEGVDPSGGGGEGAKGIRPTQTGAAPSTWSPHSSLPLVPPHRRVRRIFPVQQEPRIRD